MTENRKPQAAPDERSKEEAAPDPQQKPAMEKVQEEAARERENERGYQ